MKKMRRSRDERKKITNIGKNENQDKGIHISPVKPYTVKDENRASIMQKTPFVEG
jgi:hypothetical protein